MRVGLFLDDFRPEEGGNYTLFHDLMECFLEVAGDSRHQFTLFCSAEYAAFLDRSPIAGNVRARAMRPRGVVGQAVAGLRHYLPVSGYVLRRPGALERLARGDGVQLMWFLGRFHDSLDIPYVSTVCDLQHRTHPWFPEFSANWTWDHRDLLYSRHLRRATRIITGTEVGRSQIESIYGVPREHIRILPHPTPGFALKAAESPVKAPPLIDESYMFYPAQFWAHKNHVNLLLAWREMLDRGRAAPKLVFVGSDKGNLGFVQSRAQDLGLKENVLFMGFVSTEDLVSLYRHAEAMIYASFSGPENLPPLEAFALGCPVIASDFPGAREQLGDAVIYFEPHDPCSIAQAVLDFADNNPGKEERRARGVKRARERTGKGFVARVFKLFDEFEAERRCWD